MVWVETSFPRGGTLQKNNEKKEKIDFGARQERKSIKKATKKKPNDIDEINKEKKVEAISAELLNYKTIQEGMLIMGKVRTVSNLHLKVSLPGRMIATVLTTSISHSYSNILKEFVENSEIVENFKALDEIYTPGQSVYGKIIELRENKKANKLEIFMSLKPSDVHSELYHGNIKKGIIFNGAIEEIQDHGYIIESGIQNLRCFLPKKNANKTEYCIGQLIFLKIDKLTQSKIASTAVCSVIFDENHRKIKDLNEPVLEYFMPTVIVNFTIKKILKDGLQGSLMNDSFTGYINEHQLSEPFSLPHDYNVNATIPAKILYVMPLTKLVYLSLNLNQYDSEQVFQRGDIIENAIVHHHGTGGIIFTLNSREKGLLSFKSIKTNYTGNYDKDEALSKYHKKSKHKIRILNYDAMDSLYICSDNLKLLNEKYFSLQDCNVGDIVNAEITGKNKNSNACYVRIGNCQGIIDAFFLSNKSTKENQKIRCRIIATDSERNQVYLTNRSEYLEKSAAILTNIKHAKENKQFLGTIVKCTKNFYVVKFFNNIKGILYKSRLVSSEFDLYREGRTMLFKIYKRDGDKLILNSLDNVGEIGKIYNGNITYCLETDLEVSVTENENQIIKGIVPLQLISEFPELATLKLATYSVGQKISVVPVTKTQFSVRDVDYFKTTPIKYFSDLQHGDILRGLIKNVTGDIIELSLPIKNYDRLLRIHMEMFTYSTTENNNINVHSDQICYVQVLSKDVRTKTLTVSAKLPDVWNYDLKMTGDIFARYLDELEIIKKGFQKIGSPFGNLEIGECLSGTLITRIKNTGDWCAKVSNDLQVVIKSSIINKDMSLKEGQNVDLVILWIDLPNEIVYCSHKKSDIYKIDKGIKISENYKAKEGVKCKILLKLDNVIICSIKKGKNCLCFIPRKLHFNDFCGNTGNDKNEGDFCKISFVNDVYSVAVFDETKRLWTKISSLKRKYDSENEEIKKKRVKLLEKRKRTTSIESNTSEINTSECLKIEDVEMKDSVKTLEVSNKIESLLPGAKDFWNTNVEPTNVDESSSEDDDDQNEQIGNKKKKNKAAERFRLEKIEESRLRDIEDNYANSNAQPETADQFDRLVLSEPDNSKNWINYMAFHLQSTEIDKARAIADKAIKTISFREQQEIINIWIALLNLELRYGTKDSFNEVFKKSLLSNDQCKIYMKVLEIFTDSQKAQELTDLISTITKKFKNDPEVWRKSANAYFTLKLNERAKQLMHRALASLPEREHVNTIVAFANLNHKHGDAESAHVLFEQVITSYPKRVDVWSQYIDVLVKDQQIESARRTLERAIIQKIPIKKMRAIFKKYLEFEERYGNEENVQKVKEIAANYVKNEINA